MTSGLDDRPMFRPPEPIGTLLPTFALVDAFTRQAVTVIRGMLLV